MISTDIIINNNLIIILIVTTLDKKLSFPYEETLDPWLPIDRVRTGLNIEGFL